MLNGTKQSTTHRTQRGGSVCSVERNSGGLPRFNYRGVEQLVARQAHNLKVAGSSPASAIADHDRNNYARTGRVVPAFNLTDLGKRTFHHAGETRYLLRRPGKSVPAFLII